MNPFPGWHGPPLVALASGRRSARSSSEARRGGFDRWPIGALPPIAARFARCPHPPRRWLIHRRCADPHPLTVLSVLSVPCCCYPCVSRLPEGQDARFWPSPSSSSSYVMFWRRAPYHVKRGIAICGEPSAASRASLTYLTRISHASKTHRAMLCPGFTKLHELRRRSRPIVPMAARVALVTVSLSAGSASGSTPIRRQEVRRATLAHLAHLAHFA